MINNPLNLNYQRLTTNRYVVDSQRFWRKEFNPRFKDIFTSLDILNVITEVNDTLNFGISDDFMEILAVKIMEWFSGYRFCYVVEQEPQSVQMFLSDLFFCLLDFFPMLQYVDYPVEADDLNIGTREAITQKNDTTKTDVAEHEEQTSSHDSYVDILSQSIINNKFLNRTQSTDKSEVTQENSTDTVVNDVSEIQQENTSDVKNRDYASGKQQNVAENENIDDVKMTQENENRVSNQDRNNLNQQNTVSTENVDGMTWLNENTVQDNFLSPQNQGVTPTTQNTAEQGVDGLPISNSANFTTNTSNQLHGSTDKTQNNTAANTSQATSDYVNDTNVENGLKSSEFLGQNNKVKSANTAESENGIENTTGATQKANSLNSQENTASQGQRANSLNSQDNLVGQEQDSFNELKQNNDAGTKQNTGSNLGMEQSLENTTHKHDYYKEFMDINKVDRLQKFYNLNSENLYNLILSRMSAWILRVNIATSDANYVGVTYYN